MISTTPFGARPVAACLVKGILEGPAPAQIPSADKWGLYRELCTARAAFGIRDRDLTVLNALLSFYPETHLNESAGLVVFPSNASLSERAHGMPESTLRRHIAALVNAGLIRRHDSPNGKRYAARSRDGTITRAFGFDLRPLLERAGDISHAAQDARDAADALKRLREEVVILKRDAVKLLAYAQQTLPHAPCAPLEARLLALHGLLRRKLAPQALETLLTEVKDILGNLRKILVQTDEMSGSDAPVERHHTNSNKDSCDIERAEENPAQTQSPQEQATEHGLPTVPLPLVLSACPDILPYAQYEPRSWRDLIALSGLVRAMMGITPDAWAQAQAAMGPEAAAICVAAILQRVDMIRSPGGYLRALTRKAEAGAFSPAPMIMALLK